MTGESRLHSTLAQLEGAAKLGEIKKIAKGIKMDHDLAVALWRTGQHHPRLLAALLFDKKRLDQAFLDSLAADLEAHEPGQRNQISEWLLANQLSKDKRTQVLMEAWEHDASPVLRRLFWYHQARLRWTGRTPQGNTDVLMQSLEARLADEAPEVQWAMNFTAGWIGIFEEEYRDRCVRLGRSTGLYKDEKVARNCTPSYLPEFIRIEVDKRSG